MLTQAEIAQRLNELERDMKEKDYIGSMELAALTGYRRESVWRWAQRIKQGKAIVLPGALIPITRAYRSPDGDIYFNRREIELVLSTREDSYRKNCATLDPFESVIGQLGEDGSR